MNKTEIGDHVRDILESPLLHERLKIIARNYPNLKQELHIRNTILEIFNECNAPVNPHMKAVAEHRINGNRVDLCFINREALQDPFKLELKFQFSRDFNRFEKYRSIIESDLEKRGSDAIILIVANWKKTDKAAFDEKWKLTPNLNKYICNDDSEDPLWKTNVEHHLNSFDRTSVELIELEVEEPYPVTYRFYLLLKHSESQWEELPMSELFKTLWE